MAIYYSVKYILNNNRSEIKESVYEASMVKEDSEELFEILILKKNMKVIKFQNGVMQKT